MAVEMIAADRDGQRKARLLVSVRSGEEAEAALTGGAGILDVKDPAKGSLGYAGFETLELIARGAVRNGRLPILTAAMGEVREWRTNEPPTVPRAFHYCKLGLSGLRDDAQWRERWIALRAAVEHRLDHAFGWVGVAYADDVAAGAPSLEAVVDASIETGCHGLLIDTYDKLSGRLLDLVDLPAIEAMATRLHASGLFLAVAGRLRIEDIARLTATSADIVAVRSAACLGSDRRGQVVEERVRECFRAIGGAMKFEKHSGPLTKNTPGVFTGG
jgi:uncharacterized protein (UPF0264 family)